MASRIFIKGLPPGISEDEFKKHFSATSAITDAKLIPHRRIGYVGYRSDGEAAKAVNYFNRSFIRMSRISVEIARPVSSKSLQTSVGPRKQETENLRGPGDTTRTAAPSKPTRKTEDDDGKRPDPKLNEFLEVMLTKSNLKRRADQELQEQDLAIPSKKLQAIEQPQADSDQEYENFPEKLENKDTFSRPSTFRSVAQTRPGRPSLPEGMAIPEIAVAQLNGKGANDLENGACPIASSDLTDDQWLRSRTNRLLDLVDPDELNEPVTSEAAREISVPLLADTSSATCCDTGMKPAQTDEMEFEEGPTNADPNIDAIKETGRLFIRNLPYSASEDDIRDLLDPYGIIEECHLLVDTSGSSKGFALVQFEDPSTAINAYLGVDRKPFQGRLLHILPAAVKRDSKPDEFAISKLPFKKQKKIRNMTEAAKTSFNWNSLYMNQDAVNSSIADRLGVSKSELLDPTSTDAGVKQALAETSIIQETKAYFASNGVDLDAFKRRERGDTAILVKNFPYGTTTMDLQKYFERFGQVPRVLMPPSGTIAIVEFAQGPQARAAFANSAYRRMKDSVLFLEKAPKDLFTKPPTGGVVNPSSTEKNTVVGPKLSTTDLLDAQGEQTSTKTSTVFVRNLNFNTTNERFAETFKPLDGFISARINTKTDPKKPGRVLSMGFGFLEFKTKAQAQAAISAMNGYILDDYKLLMKASHKGLDAAEEQKEEDKARKLASRRTKIIIKNLPFEATKKDVRQLFGAYGQLRSVRVPKKFDHSSRGFAFADFLTSREAENALGALKDTHLLGRRLVLEFAAEDTVDAEEEIEKMQRKVGKQVKKMALQNLVAGGRKKFNVDDNDMDDG